MEKDMLPLGMGMALAQDMRAMEAFARMPEEKKRAFIAGARDMRSREEMRDYVQTLISG